MLPTLLRALAPAALLLMLLFFPQAAMQGTLSGLELFASAVLPALLPFYVATRLLMQSGVSSLLRPVFRPLCRLMGLPDDFGALLALSWLSGTPSGASLLAQSCRDQAAAARFCACATVTSPLFLIGTAGRLLGSLSCGVLVYAVQLFAALCTGLCFRHYGSPSAAHLPANSAPLTANFSILSALPAALRDGSLSMLFIGGTIAFFSAVTACLHHAGLLQALQRILYPLIPEDAVSALLAGFFELSQGTLVAAQARLSLPLRLSLLCAVAAFGGLSTLFQAKVFLQDLISARLYFLQRLLHAALSFCLCRVICLFFP